MQAVVVQNPGPDSTLVLEEVEVPKPGANELLVKVKATALNRADLIQRRGLYEPPEGASQLLGLELSGIVEEAGSEVTRWSVGDPVFGLLPGGGYAEYAVINENMAMPKPEALSHEEAAGIPETFLTAYQALCWLGELKEKEQVLIHAAGSGVGTAAIQIANRHKCWIAATAGQSPKLEKARQLGADLTINYKEDNFGDVILKEKGADCINLILDFIGRPYWHSNMQVLAVDGRLIYLAFLGGRKVDGIDLSKILFKRLTIKGSTLRNRELEYKIKLTQEFQEFALTYFQNGKLKPVIDRIYNWSEVEQAHKRMQNNQNLGKIILTGM